MDPPPPSAPDSPRAASWDDPHHPLSAKLRLMCSYGGHIIPRPHDKSLCYVGGDTRIVVLHRHSSLADLHHRLSATLLNGRHFTLKYQLPSEDLDSLISLSTDEDLENMIDEYDRAAASSAAPPSRLRLFLFPSKPETAASMGSLLDDAKSETWFVDALNGSGLLPRGLSESAAMDALLELDAKSDKAPAKSNAQEVVVETSSSFGSSSSSPSMANLPPIKVRDEDYMMVGLNEQFSSQLGIAPVSVTSPKVGYVNVAAVRSGGGGDRVVGDDEKSEKSDHGTAAASGMRKPPLPLQPVQRKLVDVHNLPSPDSKHAGGYNLASPDSVASDCSVASAGSLSKLAIYQDPTQPTPQQNRVPPNQDPTSHPPPQLSDAPPQFIPTTHYIHHPGQQHAGPAVSSYYPMYIHHHQNDQQYPMYLLPSYDASTRPMTPPLPPAQNMHQLVVQVPAQQFQQHYMGIQPMPSQAAPPLPSPAVGGGGYGYECSSNHLQDQAYYSSMTPAAAVMFSQSSTQIPALENSSQQP